MTNSYNASAALLQLLLAKGRQKPVCCFQAFTIFLPFFVPQNSGSNLLFDRTLKTSAQKVFDIRFTPNSVKFHTLYSLW